VAVVADLPSAKDALAACLIMFVELPIELIILIISFLSTVRDKIRLRCVSRKLRNICETPSLWHRFEWPCYEDRDCEKVCVENVLKSCGQHVIHLSFPDQVPPSKLVKLLDYCSHVIELNIPRTELDLDQVSNVLDCMKQLQKLDTKWDRETWRLLTLTFDTHLKELTIRVKMHIMGGNIGYNMVNTGPFVVPMYAWVKQWMSKGFTPQRITFITSSFDYEFHALASEMFRVWLVENCNSPPGCGGTLTFYSKTSLDIFPVIPQFQIQFGQAAVLPVTKISDFGVLGLDTECPLVFLTNCVCGGNTVYKAACMQSCHEEKLTEFITPYTFDFVVDFDLSCCNSLLSGHLEQVAITCPNLQRLSLRSSKNCLKSLKGLCSVAKYCSSLRGLNLIGITKVEDRVQFWEVLSGMKLTHLALDFCVMGPTTVKLIEIYQNFVSLKAIELNSECSSDTCKSLGEIEPIFITYFPSIEFCIVSEFPSIAVKSIANNCKNLRYLNCEYVKGEMFSMMNFYSLQELCFHSVKIDITEVFLGSISAHGGLVHVILDVNSVTGGGITALIKNSFNLLTFHIYVKSIEGLDLQVTLKEMFHNRKLFTTGGYKLVKERYYEYEQHTNLLSLWNYPFWNEVEVSSSSEDTDVLTIADFDKYPDTDLIEEFGLLW